MSEGSITTPRSVKADAADFALYYKRPESCAARILEIPAGRAASCPRPLLLPRGVLVPRAVVLEPSRSVGPSVSAPQSRVRLSPRISIEELFHAISRANGAHKRCESGGFMTTAVSPPEPALGLEPPQDGRPGAAAGRPHAELPRAVAAARGVAAGHHLPGRQAGDGPRRGGPPQHPLPRLPGPDGPGPGRRPAGHRHHDPGLGVRRRPGRRPPSSTRPAGTTPASCPAPATSRATSRSTRWPGAPATSSGSSTPGSPASARSTARPASRPRWRPPFVTALEPTDRCHLNGLGMVDGRPRYVTALGETDAPAGWRANKARGGILMDVDSGEVITRGPVDAPLAALVRRPALGLRVGRGDARVRRPEHRQVRADRRGAGLHPRARLRRQPRLRRAVAGARERRLQRHPDHRAAHRRRADLRRLRRRPDDAGRWSRCCGSRPPCRRSSP